MLPLVVLALVCGLCRADYECLCNYNVEKPILNSPTHSSQTIGYMYEFDCKPVTSVDGIDTVKWKAIAFEQQVRYVEMDPRLTVQTCPGDPSIEDILTTRSAPITSASSSTAMLAKITTSQQTITRSRPTSAASTASITTSTMSPVPTSTTASAPTSTLHTTTISTPTKTQSTSAKVTNATTQSTTISKTTTVMKTSSSLSTATTTQSTTPTTTRRPTTSTTTTQSTTKQTTRPTTTSGTTTRTTQRAPPTTTRTVTTSLGNTALCSASVRQYAQQDHEILAQNGRSCYTVVPHRVSWTHAESVCNHRGGHLFHVSSSSENYFIYNLLITRYNHTVWMGLHDRGHEEIFSWTSGNSVIYTNWIPNRKSNFYSHDVEDCAVFVPYLNRGQWDDIPCGSSSSLFEPLSETHRFICQFGITTTQPGHALSDQMKTVACSQMFNHVQGNTNLCPSHLRYLSHRDNTTLAQYRSSCYEWINQRASWSHAESICIKSGGHLVQVNDAQEETFIQQFMTTHDSKHAIWIGLHDKVHEERFAWTSGDPVVYTNWIPGRKSNFVSHNTEDCVAFIPYKQGQWDDIPCRSSSVFFGDTGETHPYMCEYKINSGASGSGVIIG